MTKGPPRKAIGIDLDFEELAAGLPDDETWGKVKSHLPPTTLSKKADAQLREAIHKCVARLTTQRVRILHGAQLAAEMRRPSKSQPSPVERLFENLKAVQATWNAMGGTVASVPSPFDPLEAMVLQARGMRDRSHAAKATPAVSPWPEFIRCVHSALRAAGLKPTVTGTGYDYEGRKGRTWFQEFIAELNGGLPVVLAEPPSNRTAAFDAKTAAALRGRLAHRLALW